MTAKLDRRGHDRFVLPPMYSPVTVDRVSDLRLKILEGHAYDLSEGGMRLELDEPLQPGEAVSVHLELPGGETPVHATGRVARVHEEDDDPGPRRAAIQFCTFASSADRQRLCAFLGSGLSMRAA